jgi:pyridoxal phosphate enzyme (YggS family)
VAVVIDIAANLAAVHERIADACARRGRAPDDVRLVAVSKVHGPEKIRAAYAAGQRVFGENYVQELVEKADALADLEDLRWRFIGHLQRNKAKFVARVPAAVETVDSPRLARELDKRARSEGVRLEVLLQVNVGGEAQKSGCATVELPALLDAARALPNLDVRGLMTVPPLGEAAEKSRPYFAKLAELAAAHGMAELSMGMSGDLEVAVEEGATLVRVGTAIFGPRG